MLLSPTAYKVLFCLLAFVYLLGLFVPLMDNDAAHHANIGLNMFLTGNYIQLLDAGRPYLDKPHFLFWAVAFSYRLFGVTEFAYRFPSFLFTVLGIWSTYKLGQTLYNRETGKLAALMTASCFAIILSNNDVRMEAILTGAGMLATWQGVVWLNKHKPLSALLLALPLAIGFSTKGWSGIGAPFTALIAYILATKSWRQLVNKQLVLVFLIFCVLISPVLYCYYLQFDLHPELVIRGQTGHSGVKFILWDQNFERFQGEAFGGSGKHNTLMFFHSFLWAFAPWSLLAIIAIGKGKKMVGPVWWLSVAPIIMMAVLMTLSGYRLPHYLNVILPFSALITAAYVNQEKKLPTALEKSQIVICILALIVVLLLNLWAFTIQKGSVILGLIIVLAIGTWLILRTQANRWLILSVLSSGVVFYLLNTNFYPQLLTYQGGITLALTTSKKIDPQYVYFWPGANSASYSFYAQSIRKTFVDSVLKRQSPVWILTETHVYGEFKQSGLKALDVVVVKDYSTDKLKGKFIKPSFRSSVLDSLFLIRVK